MVVDKSATLMEPENYQKEFACIHLRAMDQPIIGQDDKYFVNLLKAHAVSSLVILSDGNPNFQPTIDALRATFDVMYLSKVMRVHLHKAPETYDENLQVLAEEELCSRASTFFYNP